MYTDLKSEEYALARENDNDRWISAYSSKYDEDKARINTLLKNADYESIQKLIDMFEDKDFLKVYRSKSDIGYMQLVIDIYKLEAISEESHTILDMADSMEGLKSKFVALKFLVWRMIYAKDDEISKEQFVSWIRDSKPSAYMLEYVARVVSEDKINAVKCIAKVLRNNNEYALSFRLFNSLWQQGYRHRDVAERLIEFYCLIGRSDIAISIQAEEEE